MGLSLRRRRGRWRARRCATCSAARARIWPRWRARPAGAAGLHHHHRGLHLFLRQRQAYPADLKAQVDDGAARRSKQIVGKQVRRSGQPAAGLGALRRARLDAGHDGHGAQSRPQRRDGRRAWPRRPATRASPRTAIAASSRCIGDVVLGVEHHQFRGDPRASQGRHAASTLDTELTAEDWKARGRRLQGDGRRRNWASPSRRTRRSSSGARSARCSAAG